MHCFAQPVSIIKQRYRRIRLLSKQHITPADSIKLQQPVHDRCTKERHGLHYYRGCSPGSGGHLLGEDGVVGDDGCRQVRLQLLQSFQHQLQLLVAVLCQHLCWHRSKLVFSEMHKSYPLQKRSLAREGRSLTSVSGIRVRIRAREHTVSMKATIYTAQQRLISSQKAQRGAWQRW
jgi:hypothetical protein